MEPNKCIASIFMETQELERRGLLIGGQHGATRIPTLLILEDGGRVTWDNNGLFMTISMAQCTWTLEILRKYATDIQSQSNAREDQVNTALQLIFSPQIFILSNGIQESTGLQLSVEAATRSGGENIVLCSVKRIHVGKIVRSSVSLETTGMN